jgi:hypothetical protein
MFKGKDEENLETTHAAAMFFDAENLLMKSK